MDKIIIYLNKATNLQGYRKMPRSFESIWNIGDIIKDESGKDDCEIIDIEYKKYFDPTSIDDNNKKKNKAPKILFKDRYKISKNGITSISISQKIKKMRKVFYETESIDYWNMIGVTQDDINYNNIIKCYTRIKVNENKLPARIVKRNDSDALNLSYISKYIEEEINNFDIEFSILDDGYTFEVVNGGIILFKNNIEYTLRIIHEISYWSILTMLPKYIKLKAHE